MNNQDLIYLLTYLLKLYLKLCCSQRERSLTQVFWREWYTFTLNRSGKHSGKGVLLTTSSKHSPAFWTSPLFWNWERFNGANWPRETLGRSVLQIPAGACRMPHVWSRDRCRLFIAQRCPRAGFTADMCTKERKHAIIIMFPDLQSAILAIHHCRRSNSYLNNMHVNARANSITSPVCKSICVTASVLRYSRGLRDRLT